MLEGNTQAGSSARFLSNVFSRNTGGAGVSTGTLGNMRERVFPRRRSLGYTHRLQQSETPSIIELCVDTNDSNTWMLLVGFGRRRSYFFIAFSIAASANGAMILYPASLGCSPSSAKSFFNIPLSSTSAEK